MPRDVTDLSLSNRVVLLGLASLEAADETPTHAPSVRRACQNHTDAIADAVVGKLDEATVARSLKELDDAGHVARVDPEETTAVGKGRPGFELAATPQAVFDSLEDDDAATPAVDAFSTDD